MARISASRYTTTFIKCDYTLKRHLFMNSLAKPRSFWTYFARSISHKCWQTPLSDNSIREENLVRVGVDVGSTHTDAVVMGQSRHDPTKNVVISSAKHVTTKDVTTGVCKSLGSALDHALDTIKPEKELRVHRVNISTPQFLNAMVQRKGLCQVAALRLCGPFSVSSPPFVDFPSDLTKTICGAVEILDGGYKCDGLSEIRPVNEKQILDVINKLKERQIRNVVITGLFSPLNAQHEKRVGNLFKEHYPEASVTLSHYVAVGQMSLLERENAAIVNESMKPLCERAIADYQTALETMGLNSCPLYFTQSDGSLMSARSTNLMPILTLGCGSANAMRGAAFISGQKADNMMVIDIGGTTTDVGMVIKGYPRETSMKVKIGGVKTMLRMPDVLSVNLGGDAQKVTDVMRQMIKEAVDRTKTVKDSLPAIMVGGGSALIDTGEFLKGASHICKPDHFEVASAVGAALCKMSGHGEKLCRDSSTRENAIEMATNIAKERAIQAGADPDTLEITEKTEAKLGDDVSHITVKAFGGLMTSEERGQAAPWKKGSHELVETGKAETARQVGLITSAGRLRLSENLSEIQETEPFIDPETGDWVLSEWDIACLSVGCLIMGCGGGGDVYTTTLGLMHQISQGKKIHVSRPETILSRMGAEHRVGVAAYMGAPSVFFEALPNDHEFPDVYKLAMFAERILHDTDKLNVKEKEGVRYIDDVHFPQKEKQTCSDNLIALMGIEIGGMNGLEPLLAAAKTGLPVVDGCAMGRAFPKVQHSTVFLEGGDPYPSAMISHDGVHHIVSYAETAKHLEDHCRDVCVKMGSIAAWAGRPLSKEDVSLRTVRNSYSRAWHIGRAVLRARKQKTSPVSAIVEHAGGKVLCTGKIAHVETELIGGFNKGKVTIEDKDRCFTLKFLNEFFICQNHLNDDAHQTVACTPDLICMVDSETGEPLPAEQLLPGMRVAVFALRVSPLLTTPHALKEVGPQAYGYSKDEATYTPIGPYVVDAFPWTEKKTEGSHNG